MPKIYGIEHIIYLSLFIIVAVGGVWAVKKYCKTQKQLELLTRIVAIVLLVSIVTNRISLAFKFSSALRLIPDSFCGMTSFLLAIFTLCIKDKNHPIFHGLVYLAIIPPLLTMFYPDFIGQASSIWYLPTISGLLHHSISFYLVLLFFVTKSFVPCLKKWWCMEFAYTAFLTFGLFLIDGLGYGSAMYIGKPLIEGTILTWFFVGTMYALLHLAFLFVYDYITKKSALQKQKDSAVTT